MAFPGNIYAPPGVYTQTNTENPLQGLAASVRLPLLIGTGSEILFQDALEVVRGSSSSVDQRVVQEDESGRAVVSISDAGAVTLGAFDGSINQVQVKHFPIVTGNGTGTTATDAASVNVTVNGSPVVVLAINGAKGILTLSVTPKATDEIKATYFFNRTDTLITDTVSDQVTPDAPVLYGEVGQNYSILEGVNDTLEFTVDSESAITVVVSPSPTVGWNAAQVAAFINSAATGTSLTASTTIDNLGQTVLYLTADRDLVVGNGTANTTLGLSNGTATARNTVFYAFQRPIVDGSNGGVTTTDPADVTVKVDGVQVIPTAVDGASGAVTLPFAPEAGAVITIQYYFNSWQDTFDYLAHRGITEVTLCGLTPDRKDYLSGTDFVLKDDKILWGTAATVEAGEYTVGGVYFDDTQVSATLVDARQYLAACAPVVNTSVSPPVENRLDFTLPLQPTTGNGRDTPLGSETYSAVANGRIDLPTDRPDLVHAYWGYSIEDALDRGRVDVAKVESSTSTITLSEPVPVGATVYATFYYNTLVDQDYSVECVTAGSSGVGTYTLKNEAGTTLLTPQFQSKSAALATVTVEFPSGSERAPDCRFEAPFVTTSFVGAVEEDVTITFASQDATLAKYTVPGSGPYYMVNGQSDGLGINIDNLGAITTDLSDPTGNGTGFQAALIGSEAAYDADTGLTEYGIDTTNNALDFEIDGVLIQAQVNTGDRTGIAATDLQDIGRYAQGINSAAFGDYADIGGAALVFTGVPTNTILPLDTEASNIADYYVGWVLRVTSGAQIGQEGTVSAYNSGTLTLTLDAAIGGAPAGGDSYVLYNPSTLPLMKGATRFLNPVVIAANEFDDINFRYVGSVIGTTATLTATLTAQTYASVTALATEIQTQMNAALNASGATTVAPPKVVVEGDSSGRVSIKLIPDGTDLTGGYLEFIADVTPAEDFCVLAGFDIAASGGSQAKLLNQPIASTFEFTGAITSQKIYDRLILKNRLIPGQSTDGQFILDQCQLKAMGGTGAVQAGLTANEEALAGIRGTIMEPTLFGEVGLSGGQDANGQPLVTFYADGGTTAQNNVYKITFEGTPVTIEFTDGTGAVIVAGGSADVPLGPLTDVNSILGQINAALTAAGVSGSVLQEGAGIRFRGASSASAASLVVGTGNANLTLGFSSGDTAYRSSVGVRVLVSALMSYSSYTAQGIAKTVRDDTNAEYLYIQSQGNAGAGTTSSVAFVDSTALRPGVGIGVVAGDGNTGESALDGFYVTSSDSADGSGTANTSVLNSGTGQDGYVGQTYRDLVTGLTFTILARAGNTAYPAAAAFTFKVRSEVVSDSNLPVNTLPGVELTVSNTSGVTVGDTAVAATYEKGGNQPSVGDVYYVSYRYSKQDFTTQLFTKQSALEAAYGALSPSNPLSLAGYLALLNGAVLLAVKQVQKDTDTDADGIFDTASTAAFLAAIDDSAGPTPSGLFPDTLTPLKGDSLELFQYLAQHCDIQSSIRYRAERSAICGFSAGTQPKEAGNTAQAVARSRMRLLYPDLVTLSLSRADGTTDTYLVDGTYFAAGFAGNRAAPTIDVATPWTRARVFGFDSLARTLDPVEQNQIAVKGVTVFSQRQSIIECRHGLTTDMSNILTKTPTVITIADEVQRQARTTLDRFSGIKYLASVTGDIEGQLSKTLKALVDAQIISAFTGVNAQTSPDDATTAEIEAAYAPVFPLLYLVVSFNLRSSL